MTFEWAEWGTPLIVLAVGILVGVGMLMRQPGDLAAARAEGDQRDLEHERKQAVQALKALELEESKMEPADYQRERKALLERGAKAIQALETDERQADAAAAPGASETVAPVWRGALYATAAWVLIGGLIWFASDQATERREGGSMTGGVSGGAAPMAAPAAPDFAAIAKPLEDRVAANPKDIEALNELTQLSLSAGDAAKAMAWNQAAIEADPNNGDAIVYKGLMAAMVGMDDRAIQFFDQVLTTEPEHPRATAYKGLLMLEAGKHEEAIEWLTKAVALQPGIPQLRQALGQAQMGAGMPPTASPMAGGPRPGGPMMGGPKQTGPAETVLKMTLKLGEGAAAQLKGGETLFISLRDPAGGPPLAAKKLNPTGFPLEVEITTHDAISMGGAPRPFPDMMSVNVRFDGDGNAMTKEGLPSAGEGGVKKGRTDLVFVLE